MKSEPPRFLLPIIYYLMAENNSTNGGVKLYLWLCGDKARKRAYYKNELINGEEEIILFSQVFLFGTVYAFLVSNE